MITWPIIAAGLKRGLKVYRKLFLIMAPAYVVMILIRHSSMLESLANWMEPLTRALNLPGEAALPVVLGFSVNLYPALGAIAALDMTTYEITVIAVLIGTCHALVIESAILYKMGARLQYFIPYRLAIAVAMAWLVSVLWVGRI